MKLVIVGPTYRVSKDTLTKVAKAAFSYLKVEGDEGEIELKFVTEPVIRELNRNYRGIDRPTDVLSFNVSADPLAAQIVICYTYTVKQAEKVNKTLTDEVSLLLIHGILHIYGLDHAEKLAEAEMQKMETEILKLEGITR